MKTTISMKLFCTLNQGKKQLSKEALGRIIGFVRSQRIQNQSFVNKSGESDLYYTVFGWTLLYVLGIKTGIEKYGAYLENLNVEEMDLVHYAAYMRCHMIRQLNERGKVGTLLRSFFAKEIRTLNEFGSSIPHHDMQSPYTQFIRLSLLEDTGNKPENKQEMVDSLLAYRDNGGGYMNTKDGLTATTNATVAALTVKSQLGYDDNEGIQFLQRLQHPSGGFSAAPASPPDMLSTATALFVLKSYGVKSIYPAQDFIEAHWLESGGFAATLLEDTSDVEYTFYGLLALGAMK